MSEPECECENAGYCQRYGIDQDIYNHAVCKGISLPGLPACSPEKSEARRKKWRLTREGSTQQVVQTTSPSNNTAALRKVIIRSEKPKDECIHRGSISGESICTVSGRTKLATYSCALHSQCTVNRPGRVGLTVVACCRYCSDKTTDHTMTHSPSTFPQNSNGSSKVVVNRVTNNRPTKAIKWAYGVTTVPSRHAEPFLLQRTLRSLEYAGFDKPHLFIDWDSSDKPYNDWCGLPYTLRSTKVNGFANWILSLTELFYRNAGADRYAIFQDDILLSRNIKQYLDSIQYPEKGYLNLMTFWEAEKLAGDKNPLGFVKAPYRAKHNGQPEIINSHGIAEQHGRGALALVFNREAVITLIHSSHMINRVMPDRQGYDPHRYFRHIDGAVCTAMNLAGFEEYVHNPSLVQHNGPHSSLTKRIWGPVALARSFRGEDFDCISLLPATQPSTLPQSSSSSV